MPSKATIKICIIVFLALPGASHLMASDSIPKVKMPLEIPEVRWKWNASGSRYLRFGLVCQVWMRYNQSNPGTLYENKPRPHSFDIGIRRLRMQVYAQPIEWMLIYTQFGINSFNSLSPRKLGDFFHDAVVEFTPVKRYLSVGGGLTIWSGHARFSSPSIAGGLMPDPPQYEFSTLDVTDQLLRKLSVYVKGKIYKLDYRLILSDPLTVSSANISTTITKDAQFTPVGKSLQYSGYFMYQFLDEESNLLPFNHTTYLSKKKVVNIGTGFEVQPKATWSLGNDADTMFHTLIHASVDFFADMPLSKSKDDCFTTYVCYTYYNYGPRYIRNVGAMNPANKTNPDLASFNGPGNAFPLMGTGHTLYGMFAYMLPSHYFGKSGFTIQPYAAVQNSRWQKLNGWMINLDAGVNFLLVGNKAKISLAYQNRPVFHLQTLKQIKRMNAAYVALQIGF